MPTIKEVETALDEIAKNPGNPRAIAAQNKMGLSDREIQAWSATKQKPDHPDVTLVRNEIFKKVSTSLPPSEDAKDIGTWDRFKIKNLIDERPDLQEKYLQKKGFVTRINPAGEVEIRKPDELQFQPIDTKGFDLWDVTDLVGDVIAGGVGIATTGAKALGIVGAPATGGGSLAAASALGAASEAGWELGRQGLGIAAGMREDIDKSRVVQAAGVGAAVPGLAKLGSEAVKGLSAAMKKVAPQLKPNAEAIKAAAKEVGVKPTPGMLYDSKFIQNLESGLAQDSSKIGGIGLRGTIKKNIEASKKVAEEIVQEASGRTAVETGDMAKKQIVEEIEEKLRFPTEVYDAVENIFGKKAYKPDVKPIKTYMRSFAEDYKFNDQAIAKLQNYYNKLDGVNNLNDLKKLRTQVYNEAKIAARNSDTETASALSGFAKALTNTRSETIKNIIAENPRLAQQAKISGELIDQADKIYADVANQVEKTLVKNTKGGVKQSVIKTLEKTPESKMINSVLKGSDPKKIAAVKKSFPEAYETLRTGKIQEVLERSQTGGEISPAKLVKSVNGMLPETKRLVFGENAEIKAKALEKVLNSLPKNINPSGTSFSLFSNQIFNILEQAKSVVKSGMLDSARLSGLITRALDRSLQNKGLQMAAKGGAFSGLRNAIPAAEDQGFTTQDLQINRGQ